MSDVIEFAVADWIKEPPVGDDPWPTLTRCEWCYEDALEDFRNGKDAREFFEVRNSFSDGLNICEHCIGKFIEELKS